MYFSGAMLMMSVKLSSCSDGLTRSGFSPETRLVLQTAEYSKNEAECNIPAPISPLESSSDSDNNILVKELGYSKFEILNGYFTSSTQVEKGSSEREESFDNSSTVTETSEKDDQIVPKKLKGEFSDLKNLKVYRCDETMESISEEEEDSASESKERNFKCEIAPQNRHNNHYERIVVATNPCVRPKHARSLSRSHLKLDIPSNLCVKCKFSDQANILCNPDVNSENRKRNF